MKLTITTTGSTKSITDKMTAPVKCPHCGHKIEFKITGLKADPLLTCPSCHKKTQIDSGGSLRKAAEEMAKLDSAWSDLFKKR